MSMQTIFSRGVTWAVLLTVGGVCAVRAADTWYVSTTGAGAGTGGWGDATNSLQGAINNCAVSGTVWVAAGVYATGGVTNYPVGTTNMNRIAITKAITVRSKDDDRVNTIIKGYWDPVTTNGPTAVRCVYMAAGAQLIGFTVTNGATLGFGTSGKFNERCGGGIYCWDTTAVISNCVIAGNAAARFGSGYGGGGTYLGTFWDCTIAGNTAYVGGGTYNSILSNCTVSGNTAQFVGALPNYPIGGGSYGGTLYDCTLTGNRSDGNGGAANVATLYSCVISNNLAAGYSGGAYGGTLTACTVVDNSGKRGGGVMRATLYSCLLERNRGTDGYGSAAQESSLFNSTVVGNTSYFTGVALFGCTAITNCIVQFNTNTTGAVANYDSTCLAGAFGRTCTSPAKAGWASGNTTSDPLFVDRAAGNYRLASNSPCKDQGFTLSWATDPADLRSEDRDDRPRKQGDSVDMGAYEFVPLSAGTTILFR